MAVEKVKPDPLNLTVNTVVGKRPYTMKIENTGLQSPVFFFGSTKSLNEEDEKNETSAYDSRI